MSCKPIPVGAAGAVPCRLEPEAEFLLLMDLKARTDTRLDELASIIDPGVLHVPMSVLRGMRPASLLIGPAREMEARDA